MRFHIIYRVGGAHDDRQEGYASYLLISSPSQLHHDQQSQAVVGPETLEPSQLFTSHVYSGPDCYIKPKGKSNLKIIRNAISTVCLAGAVNTTLMLRTLAVRNNTYS